MYDLSFVIPAYNCGKYIKECLESIVNQLSDYRIEIIVVNDCSTDDTMKMLNGYSDLNYVKIINLKENAGVSNARNIGVDNSNGKYVFFLDGDDMLIPGSIDIMMKYVKKNDYDVIRFSYKNFFKGISFFKYSYHRLGLIKIGKKYNDKVFSNFLNYFDYYSSCGQLISSKIARTNKFNTELVLGEDMNYNLYMYFNINNIYIDSTPVFYYRVNIGSVTRQYDTNKVIKKAISCYDAYYNLHKFDKKNAFRNEIDEKVVSNIVSIFSELYVNDNDNFEKIYSTFLDLLKSERPNSIEINKIYNFDYIKGKCNELKRKIKFHRFIKKIINLLN